MSLGFYYFTLFQYVLLHHNISKINMYKIYFLDEAHNIKPAFL